MNEFAHTIRRQAAEALRPLFKVESNFETDPILELVGFLLEDGAGGVLPIATLPVNTDEWLTWNQLVLDCHDELIAVLDQVLDEERVLLPTCLEAMREWAAWLVLATLDRME